MPAALNVPPRLSAPLLTRIVPMLDQLLSIENVPPSLASRHPRLMKAGTPIESDLPADALTMVPWLTRVGPPLNWTMAPLPDPVRTFNVGPSVIVPPFQ